MSDTVSAGGPATVKSGVAKRTTWAPVIIAKSPCDPAAQSRIVLCHDARKRQLAKTGGCRQWKGVAGEQSCREIASRNLCAEVDAHLLQKRALHFGDRDLEHHLLFSLNHQHVDDLVAFAFFKFADCRAVGDFFRRQIVFDAGELLGYVGSARGICWIFHRAGQHDCLVQHLDLDRRTNDQPVEQIFKACCFTFDVNFKRCGLISIRLEEKSISLANLASKQEDAVRAEHDGIDRARV